MQRDAPSDFQSDSSGFESRRPYQHFKRWMINDEFFFYLSFIISKKRASPSGQRRWFAKPIIVGSNPSARSNFFSNAETWWNGSHNGLLNRRVKTRAGSNPAVSAKLFGRMPEWLHQLLIENVSFQILVAQTFSDECWDWLHRRALIEKSKVAGSIPAICENKFSSEVFGL
jgi:hypothetical protein